MSDIHADLPPWSPNLYSVAPATSSEANTIRVPLRPVACVRFDDVLFLQGTSVPAPAARAAFAALAERLRIWPGAALAIFAHDDRSSGGEARQLAARRARAVGAVLFGKVSVWETLAQGPLGADDWAEAGAVTHMLDALVARDEPTPSAAPGVHDPDISAVLEPYLRILRRPDNGVPVLEQLTEARLLRTQDGRGGLQSCAGWNPLVVLRAGAFAHAPTRPSSLREAGPNKRVMVYLFPPMAPLDARRWPCPKAEAGDDAACRRRLWSDRATREQGTDSNRRHQDGAQTFSCRFYERLVSESPCEVLGPMHPRFKVQAALRSHSGAAPLANLPFTLRLPGLTVSGTTDSAGVATVHDVPAGAHEIHIDGYRVSVPTLPEELSPSIVRIDGYAVIVDGADSGEAP